MKLYFDAAYVAKLYINEASAEAVREFARHAESLHTSAWCLAEMASIVHRNVREGLLTGEQAREVGRSFRDNVASGGWRLIPLSAGLLREVELAFETLPAQVFLRAGDALHLASARAAGFREIWSSDRHLLKAARHFGLKGRSVVLHSYPL